MSEVPNLLPTGEPLPAESTLPMPSAEDGETPLVIEEPVDLGPVGVRVYTHRALPGRVVVRAVHESRADAVDSEMALVGFLREERHDHLAPAELAPPPAESWVESVGLELPAGVEPAQTCEWVLEHAIQHVSGGIPPWSGLIDDLRAVADRAGVDEASVLYEFARAAVTAEAASGAPVSFWSDLGPSLVALSAEDPSVRARLLDRFPPAWHDAARDRWLAILDATGALSAIWDAHAAPEVLPSGGRVDWFVRLCAWAGAGSGWPLQIARRAAALLASEGPPVVLGRGDADGALDLDLLDLLTELSVPWVVVSAGHLDLRAWARGTNVGARFDLADETRPRDPGAAVRDPEVRRLLHRAFDRAMGDAVFEEACSRTALAALRDEWIAEQIEQLRADEPSVVADALGALEQVQHTATFVEHTGLARVRLPAGEDPQWADLTLRLAALRERAPRAPVVLGAIDEQVLAQALANLTGGAVREGTHGLAAAIRSLGAFLARGDLDVDIALSPFAPHEWIGRIRALAWCASRPGLSDEQRQVLIAVLQAWSDAGLGDAGLVRSGSLRFDVLQDWIPLHVVRGVVVPYATWTAWLDDRRIVVLDCPETATGPWHARFVEWAPPGALFGEWPGVALTAAREYDCGGDREWLDAFCSALARLGARQPSAPQVEAFAAATGLTEPQAAWALAAFPPDRAVDLDLARDTQLELLAAAVPLDPADLWTDAGVEGLAAMWVDAIGKTCPIPEDLAAAAAEEIPEGAGWLARIACPASWPGLREDATWEVTRRGVIRTAADSRRGLDPSDLYAYTQLACWLLGRLPVGDPLLVNLVKVHEQVRRRLANPQVWLPAGTWTVAPTDAREAERMFADIDGKLIEVEDLEGRLVLRQRRSRPFVATWEGERLSLAVDPRHLDHATRTFVAAFGGLARDPQIVLGTWELLQSEDLASLFERAWRTPLGAGEWEEDPVRSAPHVVRIMARRHHLSELAAALYLQCLVLIDPRPTAIRRWNHWSVGTFRVAAAELVANGLVVEAAGEGGEPRWLLPGELVEHRGLPPFEAWKLPLYGWDGARFPLGRPLLGAPLHVLFARAWERCISGDPPPIAPGFELAPVGTEPEPR